MSFDTQHGYTIPANATDAEARAIRTMAYLTDRANGTGGGWSTTDDPSQPEATVIGDQALNVYTPRAKPPTTGFPGLPVAHDITDKALAWIRENLARMPLGVAQQFIDVAKAVQLVANQYRHFGNDNTANALAIDLLTDSLLEQAESMIMPNDPAPVDEVEGGHEGDGV